MEFNSNKLYTIELCVDDNKTSLIGYFKNIKDSNTILCIESILNIGKERDVFPFKTQGMHLNPQEINSIKESTEEEIALFNSSISEVQNFKDFYAKFDSPTARKLFKITYKNDIITYFYFVSTPENIVGGYHVSNEILINPITGLVELIHFNKDTDELQGFMFNGIAANITKIQELQSGEEVTLILKAIAFSQILNLQNNE